MADVIDPVGPTRTLVGATEWEGDIGQDETDRRIGEGDDFEDNSALICNYQDNNNKRHMLTYAAGARHDGRTIGNGYRIVRPTGNTIQMNNNGDGSTFKTIFKGIQIRAEQAGSYQPIISQNAGAAGRAAICIGCILSQVGTTARIHFAYRDGARFYFCIMFTEGAGSLFLSGKDDKLINCLLVGKNGVAVTNALNNNVPNSNGVCILWPTAATGSEWHGSATGDDNLGTDDGSAPGAGSADMESTTKFIEDYTAGAEDFKRKAADLETWTTPDLRSTMEAEVPATTDIEDIAGVQSADFTLYDTDKLLMGAEQVTAGGGGGGEVLDDLEAGTLEVYALVSSMNGGA